MRFKALVLLLVIGGCAHPEYDRLQADAAARASSINITCLDAKECPAKWGRAVQWVSDNSFYKLRIASDTIITTEGPLSSGFIAHNSAVAVNKVPRGDGTSAIIFKSWCANAFGCVPTHEMLLVRFADFVDGGSAAQVSGSNQVAVADAKNRMTAILSDNKSCAIAIRDKPAYAIIEPFLVNRETNKYSEAQISNTNKPSSKESMALSSYAEKTTYCNDRMMEALQAFSPAVAVPFSEFFQDANRKRSQLIQRDISWGDAASAYQASAQRLLQKVSAIK
jgi:hypothetical protein